jgi:deazaflavin-dependent oxidoreductase (nitroreductase family)
MIGAGPEVRAALARIAVYEEGVRTTWMHRFFQAIGPTRGFSAVYRRLGPIVDPWLLRVSRGRIASRVYGFPALLLATTGAKTGARRTSPLLYVRDGDGFVVVGTNFGTESHPAWTGNLLKTPAAEIVVAGETIAVTAQLCDEAAFERLWPKFSGMYKGYDVYLARLTHRRPRMFSLRPAH